MEARRKFRGQVELGSFAPKDTRKIHFLTLLSDKDVWDEDSQYLEFLAQEVCSILTLLSEAHDILYRELAFVHDKKTR